MKNKVIVLGAGMVGRTIATDLSKDFEVTSADISESNLAIVKKGAGVKTTVLDFSNIQQIKNAVANFDLVVGAVPGFMGFNMLRSVLEVKKNIVDISFFPEDPFLLDALAKKNGVTAIVDCGVAPGMDNMILGFHHKRMRVTRFECMVGGLPAERILPWQYKAPFSPIDVIEEYTRPARIMENSKVVVRPALSEPEPVQFDSIGTLEAFNTDGLRTLLKLDIPDMVEKTLRYPGHIDLIKTLRDAGFFSAEPVVINEVKVRPVDVSSKILFPQWKYKEGEEDFTVMRVIVEGIERRKAVRYTYNLFDRYDKLTKTTSMARTTGYTAAAAVHLLTKGLYKRKGITPPETLGANEDCFKFSLNYLKKRNVIYDLKSENISGNNEPV